MALCQSLTGIRIFLCYLRQVLGGAPFVKIWPARSSLGARVDEIATYSGATGGALGEGTFMGVVASGAVSVTLFAVADAPAGASNAARSPGGGATGGSGDAPPLLVGSDAVAAAFIAASFFLLLLFLLDGILGASIGTARRDPAEIEGRTRKPRGLGPPDALE